MHRKVCTIRTGAVSRTASLGTGADVEWVSPGVTIGTDTPGSSTRTATCPQECQSQSNTLQSSSEPRVDRCWHGSCKSLSIFLNLFDDEPLIKVLDLVDAGHEAWMREMIEANINNLVVIIFDDIVNLSVQTDRILPGCSIYESNPILLTAKSSIIPLSS